jgi:hypothetical protein
MTDLINEDLTLTAHLSYFQQHGRLFAYHDLFGFLVGMSPDIVGLLEFHRDVARSPAEVDAHFGRHFTRTVLGEFMTILENHACLVEPGIDEMARLWRSYPIRARWVVFDCSAGLRFWRAWRGAPPASEAVPGWAAAVWEAFDGETNCQTIYDQLDAPPPTDEFLATMASWVHHDRQYARMSRIPVSRYGSEWKWPSYLRSTMPFDLWTPGDPLPPDPLEPLGVPVRPPHDYYAHEVTDADAQFEDRETTLSHLLRAPHPLLGGASYAEKVAEALAARDLLGPATRDIVEIGAGQGHLAAGVLTWLRTHHPDAFGSITYTIVDLAPALRSRQRETLADAGVLEKVSWVAANVEDADPPLPEANLVICNEVIGDLTTVKVNRALVGIESAADDTPEETGRPAPDSPEVTAIRRISEAHGISFLDAPEEFFLNLGAWRFVERLRTSLRPGGGAWITEYGDYARYPRPSTQLDHIEFSIHFGQLQKVAQSVGFHTELAYVHDLIDFDRDDETLAATRTWYTALRAMLAEHGVDLTKVAYTRSMFLDALEGRVALENIGDIRFEPSDERCMGLVPHEFKGLILRAPCDE